MATPAPSSIDAQRLALEREKLLFVEQQAAKDDAAIATLTQRALDFEYLKLAVVLILLIIIVYYLTCRFGFGIPTKKRFSTPPLVKAQVQAGNATGSGAGGVSAGNAAANAAPVSVPAAGPVSAEKPATPAADVKKEYFSPYASILTPDIDRSDQNFDFAQNMPYKTLDYAYIPSYGAKDYDKNYSPYSSEDALFKQTHDLVI